MRKDRAGPVDSAEREVAVMADMTVERALKLLASSVRHRHDWREDARQDFEFVAGHQWPKEDTDILDDAQRPYVTFNEIGPIVDAVAGHEVSNRQSVAYIPRKLGAAGPNEVLTGGADWVREGCDAAAEESTAFYNATVCGEGWTDTEISYDQDPDGKIETDNVDPLEMDYDPLAVKENVADSKWRCRTKIYDRSEAQEKWPKGKFMPMDRSGDSDDPVDVVASAFYITNDGAAGRGPDTDDEVLIHDFQWWEHKKIYRVPMRLIPPPIAHFLLKGYRMDEIPDGSEEPLLEPRDLVPDSNGLVTLSQECWSGLISDSGLPKELFVELVREDVVLKQKQRCYYRLEFSGSEELDRRETPTGDSFTYKAMTGKRDRKRKCWYGIVRAMKDPQRWANKFMSTQLESIGTSAKGGILYEPGAFLDQNSAENDWSDPSKNIAMNDGAIAGNKVMPRPVNTQPPQMMQLMTYAQSKIPATAGVNPEVMGLSQALDPSGVMEEGRRMSGLNMLSYLFDSKRRYMREQGRLLLSMIKKFIPEGRLIKITGPDGAQYVPLAYDKSTTEYDVKVDESPTSVSVKQKTWDAYIALLPESPMLASPPIQMIALDYSPFPASMVEKIKQAMQAQSQQKPQLNPLEQAKVGDLQASAGLKQAQAQQLGQESQIKTMLAQIEAQSDSQKANAEVQKAYYDFLATQAKYQQAIQDNQTKQAGAYFDHLKSLYGLIESAHGAAQAEHGTAQAEHGTAQAGLQTLQSAHQTIQTLNQPETPDASSPA